MHLLPNQAKILMKWFVIVVFCISMFIPIWENAKWKAFGYWMFNPMQMELMVNTGWLSVAINSTEKSKRKKKDYLLEPFICGAYVVIITEGIEYVFNFIRFS